MKEQRGGFAKMDPARQREIARKGGIAAHQKGKAHEFSSDEARAAGRKGGVSVSRDSAHMSRIGRMGGLKSGARPKKTGLRFDELNAGARAVLMEPERLAPSENPTPDVLAPLGERELDPE